MTADDTRQSILEAAEALLGEVGYAAMSLRTLTQRAGVNLAGVNYHFGSKEDLAKAVLSQRIAPVNAERHRRLDELERGAHADAPLPLRDIVAAFVAPAMELAVSGQQQPCAMIGRIIAERPPFLRSYLTEQFREVAHRFAQTLVRSVPGLSLADAFWRLHFMVGAMTHTMQHASVMSTLTNGACHADDPDEVLRQLAAFCVSGVSAPALPPLPRANGNLRAAATDASRARTDITPTRAIDS